MKAFLKNYRQSPRKVRLAADLVKGKSVPVALTELKFLTKRSASPLAKLISSAVANAKQQGETTDSLVVKSIRVDKGIVMKRIRARARGSASRINKRTSRILVELAKKS